MNSIFKLSDCGSAGVGLVAVDEIKQGTIIYTQKPLISIATRDDICYLCFTGKTEICKNCNNNLCTNCNGFHRKICPVLMFVNEKATNYNTKPGPCLIITLYLLVTQTDASEWSSSNYERLKADQGAFSLANIARDVLASFDIDKSINDILRIIACVSGNSFTVTNINSNDGNTFTAGIALYNSPVTKLNHCCKPNCKISFSNNVISIETIKNISMGEQLLISYIDTELPKNVRHRNLLTQYGFECKCIYCYGTRAEYRESMLRFNFCPGHDCHNAAKEAFNKIVKLPKEDVKVECRVAFEKNFTEPMPRSVAVRLGLLASDGINLKCWRCEMVYNNAQLSEKESLVTEGVSMEIMYNALDYIKKWIHPANLKFRYWLNVLQGGNI